MRKRMLITDPDGTFLRRSAGVPGSPKYGLLVQPLPGETLAIAPKAALILPWLPCVALKHDGRLRTRVLEQSCYRYALSSGRRPHTRLRTSTIGRQGGSDILPKPIVHSSQVFATAEATRGADDS